MADQSTITDAEVISTDLEPTIPAQEPTQDNNPPPEKTVVGMFSLVYTALDEAGKLCKDDGITDKTEALRVALDAIPQSDLDCLVTNVVNTYKNLENLHVIGLGFEKHDDNNVRALFTVKFGDRAVTLGAPFDINGSKEILKTLGDTIDAIKPPSIILPN